MGFWNADLQRRGPGLLAQDAMRGSKPDIVTVVSAITALDADILVLSGFDFDTSAIALTALNNRLPAPYPYLLPLRSNAGVPTGYDLDGNGRVDEARDSQGFGQFPGQGAMAILSRFPILADQGKDFSDLLWKDLPKAHLPPLPEGAVEILKLSTNGHHQTAILLDSGRHLSLLTWHATTPAFDGPEDRNGKRNADETRFWTLFLDGKVPFDPPTTSFALIGQGNVDPEKGDGDHAPIRALLSDPRLHSPLMGDTSDYGGQVGTLRTAYILPDASLTITDSRTEPRPEGARHHPIWVEFED
ncbi:endonuclease/exonuclease/phosphatase family protein [Thioclava sp. FR2]|uniref:endonuclease/exonuclease/phosphatase family protein n=1 Tax=Thioclava sp. FR2 TaxID=3445780 RepID=UPI003EBDF0F5